MVERESKRQQLITEQHARWYELKPYTSYMITVAAFTSAGDGNASQINVTSDEGGKFFLTQKSQP